VNDTIRFWLDYFGGQDVAYIAASVVVVTQLIKPFIPAGKWKGHAIRTLSAILGTAAGLMFIEPTSRGAMVGMSVGSIASFAWFVAGCRLEAGDWSKASKLIAARMRSR